MSSSESYLNYILEKLSCLNDISFRKMMGEYIIYYQEKVIGGIYDDRFLLKQTKTAKSLMPDATLEQPYKGAKEILLIKELDNQELIKKLISSMYNELTIKKEKIKL